MRRLNQLTWEAALLLPAPLVRELMKTLSHKPDARTTKEILLEVRGLIRGTPDDLSAAELVHFNPPVPKLQS
jgi:hypothetical protein